jgi:hypothetical protein
LGNLILIWFQNPNATRVAGFNTWKELGRFVKKGEKGLMILAPCFPPAGKREKKTEEEEEEEEGEEKPRIIRTPAYFRVVYVFDVSQTEGAELPEVEVPVVQDEDSRPLFELGLQYADKIGINMLDQPKVPVSSDTMGYYAPRDREIWVRSNVPQNQQTKSLFHELAHSRAEDKYGPEAEVLAESVAFAVCNHFGFDTGARSFPYVALWARDVKVLKQKLDQIRSLTKEIVEEVTVLAQMRDPGRLEDFGGLGTSIVSGLGFGLGIKALHYIFGEKNKNAGLEEWHTEGLACKYCGQKVPPGAIPEVWAGYHIKYGHRDQVKALAAERLPWVAGLMVVGESYPLRKAALKKLEPYTIIEVHDDGDLTVLSGGKEWVVSTEGQSYVNRKLEDSAYLAMKLLTQEIRKRLPPLRATEHQEDPIARVKFFTPWTYWTWYATEFDGEDEFFGLVRGHEIEMGYFSLRELESIRGPFGLRIERDLYFKPTPLSKIRAELEAGKMASAGQQITRQELIQRIIEQEVMGGRFKPEESLILERARELAKFGAPRLREIEQSYRGNIYDVKKTIERASHQALGHKIPSWLSEGKMKDMSEEEIEEFADEYVLPELRLYPGDKLSLDDIRGLVKKSRISGKPPAFTDEELEAALDYLEGVGEVITREKTAEKPKLWIPTPMGDPATLAARREVPKDIEVYTTTIEKHYRPVSAFHKDSFRVSKPNKNTLVYLGCLKRDKWRGEICSENQALHKTIVKRTESGMKEVRKLEKAGVRVKYFDREGVEPTAEDDIMEEIAQAINKAQPVE